MPPQAMSPFPCSTTHPVLGALTQPRSPTVDHRGKSVVQRATKPRPRRRAARAARGGKRYPAATAATSRPAWKGTGRSWTGCAGKTRSRRGPAPTTTTGSPRGSPPAGGRPNRRARSNRATPACRRRATLHRACEGRTRHRSTAQLAMFARVCHHRPHQRIESCVAPFNREVASCCA